MTRQITTAWHHQPLAQTILHSLTEQDVRIARVCSYERGMAWAPATDHGCKVFDRLEALREAAIQDHPLNAVWQDLSRPHIVQSAALAELMNAVPPVPAALALRFGSPDRWQGYDPLDATRRFRASFADYAEWAA